MSYKQFTPEKLQAIYLEYRNNYLTIEKFAEHNHLSVELATLLIKEGREMHEMFVKINDAKEMRLNRKATS